MELLTKAEIKEKLEKADISMAEFCLLNGLSDQYVSRVLDGDALLAFRANVILDYWVKRITGEEVFHGISDNPTHEEIKRSRILHKISLKDFAKMLNVSLAYYLKRYEKPGIEFNEYEVNKLQAILNEPLEFDIKTQEDEVDVSTKYNESKYDKVYNKWGERGKIVLKVPLHRM